MISADKKTPEMKKFQTGQRTNLEGFWINFSYFVTALMVAFHVYILAFQPMDPWLIRISHLQFIVAIGFIYYSGWGGENQNVKILDVIFILLSVSSMCYVIYTFDDLIFRAGVFPTPLDTVFGLFATITVIELTRRTVGNALTILVLIFILYCFIGPYLPGMLWHKGYSVKRVISYLFSTNGIYNIPLGVTARFVYIFILFGAFLELSGASNFFMDLAFSIAGKARGGPAKVAVLASGLFGMVNGTSTGNVVTTGTLTIPLMKRVGYSGNFAGAVESCASTGGQIMPPIMGAAVFLMAQLIERPYLDIMVASIIPAILYYFSIFIMVDMESVKLKLSGMPKEQIPTFKTVIRQCYLSLPVFVLLYYLVVIRSSVVLAGLLGLATAFIIGIFSHLISGKTIKLKDIFTAMNNGGKNVIQVSVTCAAAGIIMGVLTLTGMGMKIATIVITLASGNLILALILTMIVTIVLGMGLPTIAAYAITASVVAPALVKLGVPELPAHLFVLYFSCLSAITPPVALASYAAAAIARVSPMQLAITGMKLGLAGFIIPFMFVYGTPLLLMGSPIKVVVSTATALLGIMALAVSLQGYLWGYVNTYMRIAFFIAAIVLIKPGIYTDLPGAILFVAIIVLQKKVLSKKPLIQTELSKI